MPRALVQQPRPDAQEGRVDSGGGRHHPAAACLPRHPLGRDRQVASGPVGQLGKEPLVLDVQPHPSAAARDDRRRRAPAKLPEPQRRRLASGAAGAPRARPPHWLLAPYDSQPLPQLLMQLAVSTWRRFKQEAHDCGDLYTLAQAVQGDGGLGRHGRRSVDTPAGSSQGPHCRGERAPSMEWWGLRRRVSAHVRRAAILGCTHIRSKQPRLHEMIGFSLSCWRPTLSMYRHIEE
mmetsp:Transcript_31313/g.101163  ORF Transcript_31313/g.101163 Transcript_31313/m.101163 type:complete len:234 (-) Transcript_31313:428-1129(-)